MSDSRLFNARVRWVSLAVMLMIGALVSVSVWQYCWAEVTSPTAVGSQRDQDGDQIDGRSAPVAACLERRDFAARLQVVPGGSRSAEVATSTSRTLTNSSNTRPSWMTCCSRATRVLPTWCFSDSCSVWTSASSMVDDLLKQNFDFTKDEEMVTEPRPAAVSARRGRGAGALAAADRV